jgi:hypothetical protein
MGESYYVQSFSAHKMGQSANRQKKSWKIRQKDANKRTAEAKKSSSSPAVVRLQFSWTSLKAARLLQSKFATLQSC